MAVLQIDPRTSAAARFSSTLRAGFASNAPRSNNSETANAIYYSLKRRPELPLPQGRSALAAVAAATCHAEAADDGTERRKPHPPDRLERLEEKHTSSRIVK